MLELFVKMDICQGSSFNTTVSFLMHHCTCNVLNKKRAQALLPSTLESNPVLVYFTSRTTF